MTIHASKGLEFGVCAVAECWSRPKSAAAFALGPVRDGARELVLRPNAEDKELAKAIDGLDPEELEDGLKGSLTPLSVRYARYREEDRNADAYERARLLYVALTRAREVLILGVAAAGNRDGVPSSPLAAGTLEALLGGAVAPGAGESVVEYGGSAPAYLRCVVVETEGKGDNRVRLASSGGALEDFDGPLPGRPADVVRVGCGSAAPEGGAGAPGAFDLYESKAAIPPTLRSWRAREGVFSYSSVHAGLALAPAPTREARAAEAEGAPCAEDADRATNLGSAFHELAQAMVEGGDAGEGRVAAQVRRWHLSSRAEARLRAALARWRGSSVRAEALSWDRVSAEVPFFQPQTDSPHGDYLEGAMDLLCTDADCRRALVVDYKTGDAGLSIEEVRERHAMQAEFYAGVLLAESFERVECAFVCVERDDPETPGEPLVVRYAFGG